MREASKWTRKDNREPCWHDNPQNPWEVIESIQSLGFNVFAVIHAEPRRMPLNDRS